MKLWEVLQTDRIGPPTPTVAQLSRKYNCSAEIIQQQLDKGIEVEKEHTSDISLAAEIALDHLSELPDYYDRLEKMENDK